LCSVFRFAAALDVALARASYNHFAVFPATPARSRSRKLPQEPDFSHPPQWIHEAAAAKCFLRKETPLLISRRREAKRRALLQMLDRIPIRTGRAQPELKPAVPPVPGPLAAGAPVNPARPRK